MTATDHDLDTVRSAAKKSAREAFGHLANTEPERSRQAADLENAIDRGFYSVDMEELEKDLGRGRTDEEEAEYISTWKETVRDLKAEHGLS